MNPGSPRDPAGAERDDEDLYERGYGEDEEGEEEVEEEEEEGLENSPSA